MIFSVQSRTPRFPIHRPRARIAAIVRAAPLVLALLALGLAIPGQAQTRVDLFDKKSNRRGGVIVDERTGRVDVYDRDANRLGYDQVDRATGRVDFFDVRGNRVGSGTLNPPGGAIREQDRR